MQKTDSAIFKRGHDIVACGPKEDLTCRRCCAVRSQNFSAIRPPGQRVTGRQAPQRWHRGEHTDHIFQANPVLAAAFLRASPTVASQARGPVRARLQGVHSRERYGTRACAFPIRQGYAAPTGRRRYPHTFRTCLPRARPLTCRGSCPGVQGGRGTHSAGRSLTSNGDNRSCQYV